MPYSTPVWVQRLAPSSRLHECRGSPRPKRTLRPKGRRYTAVLLFEFNVTSRGRSLARRLCEERVIVFPASTAKAALAHAKAYGRAEQHSYTNARGGKVRFRFVGLLDLLHVGVECGPEEVWYGLRELLRPMERRRSLVPPEASLNAVRIERAV